MKWGRHINEFSRTSFANSGRAAGHGMVEDNYGDESGAGSYIRQGKPIPIAEREEKEEDPPVTVYYIKAEDKP